MMYTCDFLTECTSCPDPFPVPSATLFFDLWRQGVPGSQAAEQFDLSKRTVQYLFAQFRERGADALMTQYENCGNRQSHQTPASVVKAVCRSRRKHPQWGAPIIHVDLAENKPDLPLPSVRTSQRHLQKQGLHPTKPLKGSPSSKNYVPKGTAVHFGWQIDASENIPLQSGRQVSWLRVVEECSGAVLGTKVFAQQRAEHVDRLAIQQTLRDWFAEWGLPQRLRMDNGYPWNTTAEFPSEMALWLIGLGIEILFIPAGRPQHNGVVEKSQGTGKRWAEPGQCRRPCDLQRRVNTMDRRHRENYPMAPDNLTRMQRYPELAHSGRPYTLEEEAEQWNLQRVLDYFTMRALVAERTVDRGGYVSLYSRRYYVGKKRWREVVYASLDPSGPSWRFENAAGHLCGEKPAEQFDADRIRSLRVSAQKRENSKPKNRRTT